MSHRRLVQLFVLAALLVAPLGRIGISQAMAAPDHAAMASHCAGQPLPDADRHHKMGVDCLIACAAMASVPATLFVPPVAVEAAVAAAPLPRLAGIRPEADPPPPRFA
ncbi:MAG TPA: hypothetical protein VGW40_06540 [Allosphingosinicella sp.]|nr:hypothetical protein [Allosphingosinicella sp.]